MSIITLNTRSLPDSAVTTAKIAADAITDAKIADDVVGTEHLTAGEVDATALGADSVTAAKINNDIISGTTALTSAPDDTDEFLVSDAGTLKRIDYSLIKGTSGLSLISNTTISSAGYTDITDQFTSSFVNYRIIGSGINMATDKTQLAMQMLKDSDDSADSASQYNYSIVGQRGSGNAVDDGATGADRYVIISNSANTGQSINFDMTIYKPFVNGNYTSFTHICGGRRSGGDGHMTSGGGYLNQTTQYSGLRFVMSSGNISAGNILIFEPLGVFAITFLLSSGVNSSYSSFALKSSSSIIPVAVLFGLFVNGYSSVYLIALVGGGP